MRVMDAAEMFYCVDDNLNRTDAFEGRNAMMSAGMVYVAQGYLNPNFPVPECQTLFVDSGGFQATDRWDMSYPYDPKDLFEWAESIGADYVAAPDFACEPELHDSSVRHRIARTTEEHAAAIAAYDRGDYSFDLVPVIQGYSVDAYEWCINRYKDEGLVRDYMAVGTVCKRDSVMDIINVVDLIERELPETDLHMFGMTLNAWKNTLLHGRFRSADTAAWNWGASGIEEKRIALDKYSAKINRIQTQMNEQTTL